LTFVPRAEGPWFCQFCRRRKAPTVFVDICTIESGRVTLPTSISDGRRKAAMVGDGGVSPGPASPSKRSDQERAAIIHRTCRIRLPPTVPARSLLCGGADVLACIIRSDPKTRQRGAWKTARPGAPRWPSSPMLFECNGVGSCAWGVMLSLIHAVRMERCGHLVPFQTNSPRPQYGSHRRRCARARRAGHAVLCSSSAQVWAPAHGSSCRRLSMLFE
jgi:hypothetical protein